MKKREKAKGLLYTPLKVFHYPEKLASLPEDVEDVRAPLHIRVKPTNVCNHNCSYCAYRVEDMQLGQDMSIKDFIPRDKMMEIMTDVVDMGVKAITFSGGGDPLCYPYLADALKILEKGGVAFASLTNGALLKGECAEIFARSGAWIRISMDGYDGPSYAKYRSVSEKEFGKVMDNMEAFKQLGGDCFLGVSFIVDKDNADHVYPMLRRFKDIGIDSVKVSPCIVSNSGEETNEYHRAHFDSVKEQAARAIEEFADDDFEIFDAFHELGVRFDKQYTWCPFLQIVPVIAADQRVYACHDKAYNLENGLLGSLEEVGFKDFWMEGKEKFFSINPAKDCPHHCAVHVHNTMVYDYLRTHPDHLGFV